MGELQVVTDRGWMVRELAANSRLPVRHSHGLDIPVHGGNDAWWIAQGTATRFRLSGVRWHLQAPGPEWLANLPLKYVGRGIEVLTFSQLRQRNLEEVAFVKFAEAKSEVLPAGVRPLGEAVALLDTASTPADSTLLLSEPLALGHEWRFYVRSAQVLGGSRYLTREAGAEYTHYDLPEPVEGEGYAAALTLAREVAARMAGPDGYVLDVGLTVAGEPLVIEANPAWCAAWYGTDVNAVVSTIEAASRPNGDWRWEPDASLTARYAKARPLPRR